MHGQSLRACNPKFTERNCCKGLRGNLVASFGVFCLFLEHSLASEARGGILVNSPQARANMGMCVLPLDEAFSGHLPIHGDF